MNSMTGYGRSSFLHEDLDVSVEASSVNKRNLETQVSLPRDWQSLEREVLQCARKAVGRGRVQVTIKARPSQAKGNASTWDETRLMNDLDRLRTLAEKEGISFLPDANLLTQLATTQRSEASLPEPNQVKKDLVNAVQEALVEMVNTRSEEGARLGKDLASRASKLAELVDALEISSEGIAKSWREKLLERLRQAELDIDLEDERVLKEIALFAERCDVSEELTRLRSHEELLKTIFQEEGVVGRKLEFALQEVSRELNTVASKSPSVEVKRIVIDARAEIEKMREQALNVE